MNKTIFAALFALLWSATLFAAGQQYAIGVDGLACPFCAYGIEKQLNRIEDVESLSTELKSGTVIITMQAGAVLTEARAKQAVEKAGFTLRSFKPQQ